MSNLSAGIIVLAAGASTRMGQPKQLLRYGGETLLRRAVNVALNSQCQPVIVVLGSGAESLRAEIAETNAHIAINPDWAAGMASSIRCGIHELEATSSGKAQAAILMLCDQPFITPEIIDQLLNAYRKDASPIVASMYELNGETVCGVPALFHRALFPELLALQGAEGAKRVIAGHRNDATIIHTPAAMFDVDTPDDYQTLDQWH